MALCGVNRISDISADQLVATWSPNSGLGAIAWASISGLRSMLGLASRSAMVGDIEQTMIAACGGLGARWWRETKLRLRH